MSSEMLDAMLRHENRLTSLEHTINTTLPILNERIKQLETQLAQEHSDKTQTELRAAADLRRTLAELEATNQKQEEELKRRR